MDFFTFAGTKNRAARCAQFAEVNRMRIGFSRQPDIEPKTPNCPKCRRPLRTAWSDRTLWACVTCDEGYPKAELR